MTLLCFRKFQNGACLATLGFYVAALLSAPAFAQFVPLEADGQGGENAPPPNLKMLKRLPSAPLSPLRHHFDLNIVLKNPVNDSVNMGASNGDVTANIIEQDDANDTNNVGNKANDGADAWLAFSAFQRGQYLTAMELALPRAQLGDPAAQTLIAELFVEGFGVRRSMDDAVFWYEQAARNGDASAQYKLALLLTDGRYVERDQVRAHKLMQQAAEGGHPSAQFNYAQILVAERPGPTGLQEALPFFERAAMRGIPDAQYAVSQIYLNALDISDEKRALGRQYLISAARAGFDTAQMDLAIWLIDGIGGARDFEAGYEWMRLAAIRGNVLAQNRLAHLYIQAIGTRGDPIEAAKWYITARRAGLEDPRLDDFYQGLTLEQQKQALELANKLRF